MIIKTNLSEAIYKFLNKNLIVNLNLIGFMENTPDCEIYVDNEETPTGVIARKDYFSYLYVENDDFLNEALDTLYKDGFYGFSGIYRPIAEKIRSRFVVNWESRCYLYYYPKKEADLSLIKNPVQSVDMKDVETVDHFYTYRDETSLERIKTDIENRSSSAVYVNGDIASWVLVHNDNSMGVMFTKDEYRGKGYAVDVSIDLTDKILKSGRIPFLQIVESNNMSPGLAKKCGFVHEGDFSDWFGIVAGTPKEMIDMHEECDKKFKESLGGTDKYFGIDEKKRVDCMYIMERMLNKNHQIFDGFKIEAADDDAKILEWCETLASGLSISPDEKKEFVEKTKSVVTNEKHKFKLVTGKVDGKPVSTTAFLNLYDDVCGIYMTSAIGDGEKGIIERSTLTEGIEKLEGYLCFINFSESASKLYKELGFVHTHYKTGEAIEK